MWPAHRWKHAPNAANVNRTKVVASKTLAFALDIAALLPKLGYNGNARDVDNFFFNKTA